MLLLNFEILAIGRMVLTDMVLVFFTTLSIFCFFTAMWGAGNSKRWYWGFYLGMAFGVLTKGAVGLLVPLLAIGSYLLLTRPWKTGHSVLQECHPLAGTFLLIAIAAPWYGAMFVLHGGGYGQSVKGDTVTRFFSAIGGHGGTIFFYLPVLFLGFFPWSGFLPSALYDALRGIRDRPAEEPRRALIVLSALWIIAVIIFLRFRRHVFHITLPHCFRPPHSLSRRIGTRCLRIKSPGPRKSPLGSRCSSAGASASLLSAWTGRMKDLTRRSRWSSRSRRR